MASEYHGADRFRLISMVKAGALRIAEIVLSASSIRFTLEIGARRQDIALTILAGLALKLAGRAES